MRKRVLMWLMIGALVAPVTAFAGPIEDARSSVEEGRAQFDKAKKTRKKKKKLELLVGGLRDYARAYIVITSRKLENDAPDLLQEISDQIKEANELPDIVKRRDELRAEAIAATEEGRLTDAYDRFNELRFIDPRKWTINYALTVIGQRMEGE